MLLHVARHSLIGLGSVLLLQGSVALCASLESLDLASLFAEADAIVLVDDFVTAGPKLPGSCLVKKSYAGAIELGTQINVIPWSAQLKNAAALIRERTGLTCVFFLKRQREGDFWGTTLSGIRVIGEEKVFGVAAGPTGLYELVPAAGEGLRPLPDGKPYDHAALEEDLATAADRARRVQKALLLPKNAQAVTHLRETLEEEVRRVFPGGSQRPAVTRSELVMKLELSLLEKGETDAVWTVRAGIPAGRFRSELDAMLLERSTLDFIRGRLEDVPPLARSEMLSVLAASGFQARNAIKPDLLRRIFDSLPSLEGEDRFTGHAAIVELYRGLPLEPGDVLLSKLIAAVASGDSTALYHFGPLLSEREPVLALKVLPDQSRLFALVTIEEASTKRVEGRVDLHRLPAGHSCGKPEIIFHRTGGAGTVAEIRKHALEASPELLAGGKSGLVSLPFSARFEGQPLPSGAWRAFVEASWAGGASSTWRSGGTTFKLTQ